MSDEEQLKRIADIMDLQMALIVEALVTLADRISELLAVLEDE